MKAVRVLLVAALAVSLAAPAVFAEPRQLLQGTQIHLQLLTDISTSSSKDGDPFMAIVTEPVAIGDQMVLPAGTRVNGIITMINKARRFSIFRGEAYMNLTFRSVEIDSRLIPVQMSLLSLEKPSKEGDGRRRKDVKITEGQVVEQKHDIKGDIVAGTIGTGGGTLVGGLQSGGSRIWHRHRWQRHLCCRAQGQGSEFARQDRNARAHGQYHHRPRRHGGERQLHFKPLS